MTPDKGQGGKYLILPPGGPDIINPEFIVRRSATNQLWFATRGGGLTLPPLDRFHGEHNFAVARNCLTSIALSGSPETPIDH